MNRSSQFCFPLAVLVVLAMAVTVLLACGGTPVTAPKPTRTLRPTFTPTTPSATQQLPTPTPTPVAALPTAEPGLLTPTPSTGGSIAFESKRDGFSKICVVNADASALTCLTDNPADDRFPDWSPDGARIAFVSDRDSDADYNEEIYVMNADGSGQTRLTHNAAADAFPDWSPDGTRIAFVSDRDGNEEIYVMNADGSSQTRITDTPADEMFPDWSPDGTRIVYVLRHPAEEDVWVMNADGTGQTRLTSSPWSDGVPRWSPDGTRIAFLFYDEDKGNGGIYTMNSDGSDVMLLAQSIGIPMVFAWSPDGTRMAFSSYEDLDGQDSAIYVINTGGSGLIRLTNNAAWDDWPSWSRKPLPATSTPQPPQVFPFVVSGTLSYRKQALVPEGARVVVVWLGGDAAGDEGYVFGEGTVNAVSGSFELMFDEPPPPEALYRDGSSTAGMGLLLLTTGQGFADGSSLSESSVTDFLGASEHYVIVYVSGRFEGQEEEYGWLTAFRQGYSVGRERELSGTVLEELEPTDPTTVEVIVDDPQNIEYPLWW
jgi:TolB protein